MRPSRSLVEADCLQRLEERLRAMRFVEQNEAVVGGKRRVDGPSAGTATSIGPEQEA